MAEAGALEGARAGAVRAAVLVQPVLAEALGVAVEQEPLAVAVMVEAGSALVTAADHQAASPSARAVERRSPHREVNTAPAPRPNSSPRPHPGRPIRRVE